VPGTVGESRRSGLARGAAHPAACGHDGPRAGRLESRGVTSTQVVKGLPALTRWTRKIPTTAYFQNGQGAKRAADLNSCASLLLPTGSLLGQSFRNCRVCWCTGLGRNGSLSACRFLTDAAPTCAISSRMRFETLTCGSLHGRAGDCSSVLRHSACVWFWGTGGWRGGCWVQQCPRFPLQKKRRYFSFYPCSPLPPVIATLSPLHPTDKALWNMTHF